MDVDKEYKKGLEVNLAYLYKKYKELLYIEDTNRIDVVLAVALSQKLEGIPLWLIIVGASGDMKSVQLKAIRTKDVFVLHNLTSKTLVNGYKNKKQHPDLAPELKDKIIIIPDMASILKLPTVDKGELWGQLRDLYDGDAGKLSGQGSRARYEGLKVTLIAGSTPVIDGQILINQDLGSRELIYRTSGSKNKSKVMDKCMKNEVTEEQITEELRDITTAFLEQTEVKREEISQKTLKKLKEIAIYISKMRVTAEFDQFSNELRNFVYPEEPTRIVKQLKRVYICLKSLSDNYSDKTAFKILWHIAKSCGFPVRIKMFEYLEKNKLLEYSTSQLSDILKIGKSTAKREGYVLESLDLITCRKEATSYPDKFYEYWQFKSNPSIEVIHSMKGIKGIYTSIISKDGLDKDLKQLDLWKEKNDTPDTSMENIEVIKIGDKKNEP